MLAADRRAWLFVDEIVVNPVAKNDTPLPGQKPDDALRK
jgi:hypothetical protein